MWGMNWTRSLTSQLKNVKISDVENLTDDLSDLLQDTNEIQEALGRSYNVGEVDEGELEDELSALGEEMDFETPSYLSSVPTSEPATYDAQPNQPMKNAVSLH